MAKKGTINKEHVTVGAPTRPVPSVAPKGPLHSVYPCCRQGCHDHEGEITYKYCPRRPIYPQLHIPGAGLLA
jgi:hypothetical protein